MLGAGHCISSRVQHPTDHIFHHTPDSLKAWFADRRLPGFRAKQVLEWVYRKGVADPTAMSNLAKRDRDLLAADMTFLSGETITHQLATDGTQKLLIEWDDPRVPSVSAGPSASDGPSHPLPLLPSGLKTQDSGLSPDRQTECVMIPSEDQTKTRRTACLSSQVGCPVGCKFCASGLGGLDGNLSAGRIVEQVWRLNEVLTGRGLSGPESSTSGRNTLGPDSAPQTRGLKGPAPKGSPAPDAPRITNIVFMGMGEPLANFAEVVHAVRTIAAPWGLGISARKITISTVGLPQAITRLTTELDLPVTLALSLHAPNDELRRELIPWAEYSTIRELLAACQGWFKKAGREITLEYILLGGLNDRPEHA
ncbi:23S rRNA (adenine(2503)-C(2))-methyltransferase @ tRNA (adenine(37)-C(2))-methyltransferase, partial [hydrothermal vent metagenome]